jgi:hypothetical protein
MYSCIVVVMYLSIYVLMYSCYDIFVSVLVAGCFVVFLWQLAEADE